MFLQFGFAFTNARLWDYRPLGATLEALRLWAETHIGDVLAEFVADDIASLVRADDDGIAGPISPPAIVKRNPLAACQSSS